MLTVDEIESKYRRAGEIEFVTSAEGATTIHLKSEVASASVSIQGGQVLEWCPIGNEPVLWLSKDSWFKSGKAIRGGVPICWPWFGVNPEVPLGPTHGFARTSKWELEKLSSARGQWEIVFRFALDEAQRKIWPYHVTAELIVQIGRSLSIRLTTYNCGMETVPITQAMHTYFNVSDISQIVLDGFDDYFYVDKVLNGASGVQVGELSITEEIDRIFINHASPVSIIDRGFVRRIRVNKFGSKSYVVWNPWIKKSEQLGDMGKDGYRKMVCVETSNAGSDLVLVAPGSKYEISTEYTVEEL